MSDRVLRGNETVLLIPAHVADGQAYGLYDEGMDPIDNFTASILNYWIPVNTAKHADANGGGNVSCAIRDDMTLGLTDSEADSDRTLCDEGQVENLTSKQYEANASGFRDKDLDADGAYNLFNKLTFAPDVPYIIAHRVGVKQDALVSATDMWDLYLVNTDVQIPEYSNNANITVNQTFIPKSNAETAQQFTP